MSLSFIFGASGAGKSTILYDMLLKQAEDHPEKNYYLIVPDQFTMQTQKDIVERSPKHGIRNIDVLSFGRLSYRVLEETGGNQIPVLDDTGKNLILRIVADRVKDQLEILGAHVRHPGYIHEIKSAISEFMQYRIGQPELEEMIAFAEKRHSLSGKLRDLSRIYQGFQAYNKDHYITTEETMEVLAGQIQKSSRIRNSTIAFDGFTGFTPVQLQVIEQLLAVAETIYVSLTIDPEEDPFQADAEQKLFYLTQKTVKQLCRCAQNMDIRRGEDLCLQEKTVRRFEHNPELSHLEQNLFHYPQKEYKEKPEQITVSELSAPREEARYCAETIHAMIRTEGYQYRDFAVVCGDLQRYAPHVRAEFGKMHLPFFLDQTNGMMMNPFIEMIRSALLMKCQDFSMDSVNHYLRSGLTDFRIEDIDELDNYMRETGIRGSGRWNKNFTRPPAFQDEKSAQECLKRLNGIRKSLMEQMTPLLQMGETASEKVRALYEFISAAGVQKKLLAYERQFAESGDSVREKEYHQIFPYIIDMLSRIEELLGGEKLTDREFADLLDAGFSEMKVGTIPLNVDHIVVGDMERTRLNNIRILFFLGVNDGNIPKHSEKGGIISDIDREFLQTSDWELAPSPRQKMYIQRLYLYLNMTKPSEKLCLTYARTGSDGKAMRPAYLIDLLRKMFPLLKIERPEDTGEFQRMETWEDGRMYLADHLRMAAAGETDDHETEKLACLSGLYFRHDPKRTRELVETAFVRYREIPLNQESAVKLYGNSPVSSITRLERFAACAYAHFLQYGLHLRERREFEYSAVDMGTLFHEILAGFSDAIAKAGYHWKDFPEEEGDRLLDEVLESRSAAYRNAVMYETARSQYALERIRRILKRTIRTLQFQFRQGEFEPEAFEFGFQISKDKVELTGRIDRLDVSIYDNCRYVNVTDYKSGADQFDINAYYHGLQLQLMTYLYAALEHEQKAYPDQEIVPSGVFYYHLEDPFVDADVTGDAEDIWTRQLMDLRLNGLVNGDPFVISRIDHSDGTAMMVLPLSRKADGTLKEHAMLTDVKDMRMLADYTMMQMKELTAEMMGGRIEIFPYERKNRCACDYCEYAKACGYDGKIPGYARNILEESDKETILQEIRTKCDRIKDNGRADGKEERDGN